MAKVVEQAIFEKLRNSTSISSSDVSEWYYLEATTGATLPYAVIWKVDDPHEPFWYGETLGGQARIQIDYFTREKYSGPVVSRKIWKELQDFQGTQSSIEILWSRAQAERSMIEQDQSVYHFVNETLVEYIDPTT